MNGTSLVRRLATLQQLMAGALVLLFAGLSIWISANALERQESKFLHDAAAQMAGSIELERQEGGDLRGAAEGALAGDAPAGVRVRVLDQQGRQIYPPPSTPMKRHKSWREARVALDGGGWVVASTPVELRRRAVMALVLALGVTAVPLVIAVAALSQTVARRALKPLSRIASQAERMSSEVSLDRFGTAADPAEVAALAHAIDRLLGRLQETLRAERHFTQDAAHELRTPLTVVCGELEYAIQSPALPPVLRPGLEHALAQGRSMSDLVDALLLLRQSEPASQSKEDLGQPVNLSDLVRDLANEFRAPGARASDLEIAAEDEVMVAGHSILLTSAIRNLLSNAFKFTTAGQSVRVRVYHDEGRGNVVVEDAGPGIAPPERERVFDPFYRGSEARADKDGFGLGLPILRRVARAHGGDVVVSDSPLGGARFELFIPTWAPHS